MRAVRESWLILTTHQDRWRPGRPPPPRACKTKPCDGCEGMPCLLCRLLYLAFSLSPPSVTFPPSPICHLFPPPPASHHPPLIACHPPRSAGLHRCRACCFLAVLPPPQHCSLTSYLHTIAEILPINPQFCLTCQSPRPSPLPPGHIVTLEHYFGCHKVVTLSWMVARHTHTTASQLAAPPARHSGI